MQRFVTRPGKWEDWIKSSHLLEACARCEKGSLRLELRDGESVIGGGSAPGQTLPTRLIALQHAGENATLLEGRLRSWKPPVIARVESDAVLLDLRTVLPEQDEALAAAICSLAAN